VAKGHLVQNRHWIGGSTREGGNPGMEINGWSFGLLIFGKAFFKPNVYGW
jgi:hypothetical protein